MNKLILVHKTHLDIGFTDLAANVTRQYLDQFIPSALARARELNEGDGPPRFVWTTGAWLIWKALETYAPEPRAELEAAIERGWIAWHALPFTFHTELLSPGLLRLSLAFSKVLDTRFGRQTISAKMTDVPGHTRGLVPVLAKAGVRFLHIGVNPASRVPGVPPLFRWQAGGAEIIVAYAGTYGSVTIPEAGEAGLAFLHTHDNLGPPSAEQITAEETWLRARYPRTEVRAGTMDDFAASILPHAASLPVVTDEIGDTWIHGIASDSPKLADFIALRRVVETHAATFADAPLPAIASWLEPLLLVAEHTWCLDAKTWFGEHGAYFPEDLAALARTGRCRLMEEARAEQRAYLDAALAALPSGLRAEADAALAAARAVRHAPATTDWTPADRKHPLRAGRWLIRLQPGTGTLASVYDTETGRDLCPPEGRLAWAIPRYELYGDDDYRSFIDAYMGPPPRAWWAEEDFRKIGLQAHLPSGMAATLAAESLHVRVTPEATHLLVKSQFRGDSRILQSAPRDLFTQWTFHHRKPEIEMSFRWTAKTPTRLPEAAWMGFRLPAVPKHCRLQKLGLPLEASDVVSGGGRHLHALDGPLQLSFADGLRLEIDSLDAPLFAPSGPALLTDPSASPRMTNEVWFNLCNNTWNTNFSLWFGEPMGYRFTFRLSHAK